MIRASNYFVPERAVPYCQHNQPRERDDDQPPSSIVMATIRAVEEDADPARGAFRETHDARMPLDECDE